MEYAVLFVCTGNICRSPTAHGVFRHHVEQAGLSAVCRVDSAGIQGYHTGEAPDGRSVSVAGENGVTLDDLRARKVTKQDFYDFDLVLAMDRGHFDHMKRMRPSDAKADLVMFLDFAAGHEGQDVPDPYYGDMTAFYHVFMLVESGSLGILNYVRNVLRR